MNPSASATMATVVAAKRHLWASLAADGVRASDGKWQRGMCEFVLMAVR
jgi:hypothetical protein